MIITVSRKQHLAGQELKERAGGRPYVLRSAIATRRSANFGCTVPASDNILRQGRLQRGRGDGSWRAVLIMVVGDPAVVHSYGKSLVQSKLWQRREHSAEPEVADVNVLAFVDENV